MLVANSFDLWQKDTFFSAAEEVQESADIMESSYRTWVKQRREGMAPHIVDELCRELQTALGTTKWQLEEFERAVRLSYRNCADGITTTRHIQFVDAMERQISCVESALKKSYNEDGKQPLRWVNLDEEERDDLAIFLTGAHITSQTAKDEGAKLDLIKGCSKREILNQTKGLKEANYVIEIEAHESGGTSDDSCCQAQTKIDTRKTWSSTNIGDLKITIGDEEEEQKKEMMRRNEATPKEKGSKPIFWKSRCGDHPRTMGVILSYTHSRGVNWINQCFRQVGGSHRQLQTPLRLQRSSVKLTLALMLTIFLIVPFVLFST